MKSIVILKDVSIPGVPGFSETQQVRVADEIADMLIDRGMAKATGEPKEVQSGDEVTVKKVGGKK